MEEFKVLIGAELKSGELDAIKSQINNIQTNPIKLKIDASDVNSQIDGIKKKIQSLSNIKINLNGNNSNNNIKKTVNEVNKAYNDLMSLQKRISSIRIQLNGLDGNKNNRQISELSGQLNRLMNDYNNLFQTFNHSFSTNQLDNLNRSFEVTNNKINSLNAKMADTSAIKSQESAYKELLSVSKQISNTELKIGGLKNIGGHTNEIAELENQLHLLQSTYQNLISSFQGQLSSSQLTNLGNIVYDTKDKLSQLDAKIADTKAKLASDIQLKINTGTFDKQISNLQTNFNKLSVSGKSTITNMEAVTNSLKNMKTAASNGDIKNLITSFQQYQTALKSTSNQIDIMIAKEKELANSEKLASAKTALSSQMDVWLKQNSAAVSQFGSQIEQLQIQLQNCDAISLSNIKSEFEEITRQAKLADKTGQTFGDRFQTQLSKLGTYFSAAMLITEGIQAMQSMYDNVVRIDSAMTELKKVTDESSKSYSSFLDNAGKRSVDIGTTISNYVNSTADFARLGNSLSNAQKLAEVANIYNVVGDELSGIDAASTDIISTMSAFNVETDNAISIVDKFNEVSNKFSISSGGIGEALTRSASSMAAAGNTLDETIALVTAANTVVQDPDSVGTAFKTISMRIRGASTELEQAGLDTEGMAESTAKLREEIKSLSGVDIMLDENTFKSTYQIMDELSQKWQDLTDIQQASITELIAGKRQGNIVSSLMNNFDIARKALNVSLTSEGSAMEEHAKAMESISAKINQLKASWEGLSQSFMSSDFLKGSIDALTNFVQIIDSLIKNLGTVPTLFAGGGIAVAIKSFA